MTISDHLGPREDVVDALRAELLGPAPAGKPLDRDSFDNWEEARGPWVDPESGEEVLDRDPLVRYGVGVLYPAERTTQPADEEHTVIAGLMDGDGELDEKVFEGLQEAAQRTVGGPPEDDDFDLAGANDRRPSTMGLSFMLAGGSGAALRIVFTGGRYRRQNVRVAGDPRRWWVRSPVIAVWELPADDIATPGRVLRKSQPDADASRGIDGLDLELIVNVRSHQDGRLITVALVNRTAPGTQPLDAVSLFQAEMTVEPQGGWLAPYPEAAEAEAHPDDASFNLLYREARTFAVGHGCAADWARPTEGRAAWAKADPLPWYEAPSITPDIRQNGSPLTVSMEQLAGDGPGGPERLEQVVGAYAEWIEGLAEKATGLDERFRPTAAQHIEGCRKALARMREGLELVRDDRSDVGRAFRMANRAMLRQQLRSGAAVRPTRSANGRFEVEGAQPDEDAARRNGKGNWRAFQIAFLLAAIPSSADPLHGDREVVDLIYFPTGGGKTEAYLGLSAFSMLLRRLRDPGDASVTVLMRYTLRLLTAQQFLRAAALICAIEEVRAQEPDLGDPFSIGIWVGSETTPNSRADAKTALGKLHRGEQDNPFLLLRCPWCAAQMGPVPSQEEDSAPRQSRRKTGRRSGAAVRTPVAGYSEYRGTVRFICPDNECRFSTEDSPLPIYVVDDDLYEQRPTLVIGTVDKFALIAWRPKAQALFGFGTDGSRAYSPPSLIIQDELHLIAGPLGSLTGLYEGVIEELCTDGRGSAPILPKIVASTATIRRHEEQVKALYGRERVHLFPPHGIDASDSFFAVYDRDPDTGTLKPGRRYIGVHAPALGSMQTTQVRTFAALLQAAKDLPEDLRDPWWTLLTFFNSLRELGNSLSLMQSDIPDYLRTVNNRSTTDRTGMRYLNWVEEMTSRLRQDQVPEAIQKLERHHTNDQRAVDACLASSLIEVGIDIPRLSLMAVVGQPKSTSQYIQVTGRVGRRIPGLVVTLYGAGKPRDRSHFERFRSYHERLYAQVEPTSSTPFAPPALDRALRAVAVAYIRQTGPEKLAPWPFPAEGWAAAKELLLDRVRLCDPDEADRTAGILDRMRKEWEAWQPGHWGDFGPTGSDQLLRPLGQYADEKAQSMTWAIPSSMRGVDAECQIEVTSQYAIQEGQS
ncbi:helicase-related protein [Streptomyces sp. NBC_00452]|uniref:helicase-related protein n=1 Tax=Streptomyces sp. NBC_00452 TaxID=2975746 RepID=UPI0022571DFD|nr:helicase-related protein [Streptomyces sp. NBC_00452]MCX5056992.1 helicase-related protein [Streptomyces sp. NBC_00452]